MCVCARIISNSRQNNYSRVKVVCKSERDEWATVRWSSCIREATSLFVVWKVKEYTPLERSVCPTSIPAIHYFYLIFFQVATLFHDASIGNAVNIVIVRLLLLKDLDVSCFTCLHLLCLMIYYNCLVCFVYVSWCGFSATNTGQFVICTKTIRRTPDVPSLDNSNHDSLSVSYLYTYILISVSRKYCLALRLLGQKEMYPSSL